MKKKLCCSWTHSWKHSQFSLQNALFAVIAESAKNAISQYTHSQGTRDIASPASGPADKPVVDADGPPQSTNTYKRFKAVSSRTRLLGSDPTAVRTSLRSSLTEGLTYPYQAIRKSEHYTYWVHVLESQV